MDEELRARLDAQEKKIDAIFVSVEKTRKYFQITLWITVAMVVIPLIGLAVVVPTVLNTLSTGYGLL